MKRSGFTVMELLVVIMIIGLLVALAIPNYRLFRKRAEEAAKSKNVNSDVKSKVVLVDTSKYLVIPKELVYPIH